LYIEYFDRPSPLNLPFFLQKLTEQQQYFFESQHAASSLAGDVAAHARLRGKLTLTILGCRQDDIPRRPEARSFRAQPKDVAGLMGILYGFL